MTTSVENEWLFWMLAATDSHAKNLRLRILQGGRYQQTPLYDVLPAWPIIGKRANHLSYEKAKLAMAMHATRAHYRIRDIQSRHFDLLGRQLGPARKATALMPHIHAATPKVIAEVQKGLPRGFPAQVLDTILEGLGNSAQRLEAPG